MKIKSKVLIIAGSDSSGGAGIQADIKTVSSLGSYAMTAVTAVTAQNTNGVESIFNVSPTSISKQIEFSSKDIRPDIIKIGMLANTKVINAVFKSILKIKINKIILDPVMVAKGGDLICKGSVGARTGIDQKGGSIIVGGDAGAFTGFMMQRGRIVILGDVGINLGDSMYDGTIYVGGKIGSFGSDAVEAPMTKNDIDWLNRKLKVAEIGSNVDLSKMTKVVAGKKLWNYDALEPTERKGAI